MLKALRKLLLVVVLPIALLITAALIWLRIDASRPLNAYFDARQGALGGVEVLESRVDGGQVDRLLEIRSDSGLRVRARVVRPSFADDRLPVLIILGGHRTGSDAVDLFGDVGAKAVVALDYPYEGPQKVRGIGQIIDALPLARRAFRDTPPSVSLVVDWLVREDWADSERLVIVGATEDERTPPAQTEALFRAAKQPKLMRWTDGRHVQPDRAEIVGELLRVADEVLSFVTGSDR